MSAEKKAGTRYTSPEPPPKLPPKEEPSFTAAQWQDIQYSFKKLFEDTRLKKWIILAGLFAVLSFALEVIRLVWLALRYLRGF